MKKAYFSLTLAICCAIVFSIHVDAQNGGNSFEPNFRKNFMPSVRNLASLANPDLSGARLLNRNEINIWAVRDFLERFEKVENALWFATPKGGFEVYFVQDGYGERVIYDKSGGWQMSLITYNEDKLARDIRAEVKSTYYDFQIVMVEEVRTNEGYEYIIYLEDKSGFRIVKVSKEGEMELLQDLEK